MPDTTYTVSRARMALIALGCVVAAVGFWFLLKSGWGSKATVSGFIGAPLFGFYGFLFAMQTLIPSRLTLNDEGFVLRHWTATERVAWRDIGPLRVNGGGDNAMIVYAYRSGELPPGLNLLHHINHAVGAFDGSLPSNLPVSNPALCAEMNARQARAA